MIEKIFWIFVLIFFKLINGQENDQQLRCSRIFDSVLWNRIQMLSDEGLVQAKEGQKIKKIFRNQKFFH